MKLYVTFGLGGNYLVAHTDNERNLRIALNATKLPWCSLYSEKQSNNTVWFPLNVSLRHLNLTVARVPRKVCNENQ